MPAWKKTGSILLQRPAFTAAACFLQSSLLQVKRSCSSRIRRRPPVRPFSSCNTSPPTSSLMICGRQTAPTWTGSTYLRELLRSEHIYLLTYNILEHRGAECAHQDSNVDQLEQRLNYRTVDNLRKLWLISRLKMCLTKCRMTQRCIEFTSFLTMHRGNGYDLRARHLMVMMSVDHVLENCIGCLSRAASSSNCVF